MKRVLTAILIMATTMAFSPQEPTISDNTELRITTFADAGVTILAEGMLEGREPMVLRGPKVSIVIPEHAQVSFNDDTRPGVRAEHDAERDWMIWKGHYTITIKEEGKLDTVLRVEAATVVLGKFETPEEGFYR